MATAVPHLEPDPFDDAINAMLADPEFVAELDRRRDRLERGAAKLHSHDEVRRIVGLDISDTPLSTP